METPNNINFEFARMVMNFVEQFVNTMMYANGVRLKSSKCNTNTKITTLVFKKNDNTTTVTLTEAEFMQLYDKEVLPNGIKL